MYSTSRKISRLIARMLKGHQGRQSVLTPHGIWYATQKEILQEIWDNAHEMREMGRMPMLICHRFHEWLANIGKIATFMEYRFWCPRAQVFLNLENRDFDRWNLRSMLKIPYAACSCLSQLVSAQFALEMCLAAQNHQKIHKTPILAFKVIQGHWIWWQSRASVRPPISD